ncbi:MAG: protein kinase [Deltaproteobacteria bacterium]|nr:protein kinase [Deltaproteobacteria bacterium]
MAEVFRAKAFGVEGFERLVAVKRILPNIAEDKEFIRMFIEEAKLSVQLNHANIAQIFDLGVVDGSYYIALEHVHGRDLRGIFDRCRAMGEAMPVAQACFMVMKVCEGLDYAHNKRDQGGRELALVHRDVSPQNVLVSFEGEVKLIDFGIAKAAGKGSKTQAGILKGKFGYMSPEQVRGLPVDRRSDVFSCGIVLYELLTGERLFVGESDFSTLEKVRNVEILPPSTYNRKIPDELERIVLKALAKDTEDRYQNAIDLHDELQAFVYTAGEFYSRKDLAGWMKKTFGKEIEEETAKLESYRQLKPPPSDPPPRAASASKPPAQPPPQRRSTQAMSVAGTKPPPPPTRMSQQIPTVTGERAAPPAPPPTTSMKAQKPPRKEDSGSDLSWDDDELETQIYDNPEDDPKNKPIGSRTSKPLPLQAPASQPTMSAAASPDSQPSIIPAAPDLSSLASTAKGWENGPANGLGPSPGQTMNGIGTNTAATNGAPAKFPSGSNKVVAPEPPPPWREQSQAAPVPQLFESGQRPFPQPSQPMPAAPASEPPLLFDPMASFGQGITKRKDGKKGILLIAIGGALVAALAVVLVIVLSKKSDPAPEKPATTAKKDEDAKRDESGTGAAVKKDLPSGVDPNTGFDLYVTPSGISQWKLDGDTRNDRLPSRIRGIAAGKHTVQIEPPPGFMSESTTVEVAAGKPERVEIALRPIQGMHGNFESIPPGATVSLIIDGKRELLGPSPQRAPLDPRNSYQVLFERPGYVSVNRPISFTNDLEQKVVVNLEKASDVKVVDAVTPPKPPDVVKKVDPPKPPDIVKKVDPPKPPDPKPPDPKPPGDLPKPPDPKPPDPKPPEAKATGVLLLSAKPPCEIYVDGRATGLFTPQKLTLPVGVRRITLINNEFSIKETFAVTIKADGPGERMLKDYTDRLPK